MTTPEDPRRYPLRPFAAVGVVVWQDDKILIIKRSKPPRAGQWGLIGGGLELGETHFECAVREVLEETGVVIEPFAIITAIDSISRDDKGQPEFHYSVIEVNARFVSGTPKALDGVEEIRWASVADIAALPVWQEMKRVTALAEVQYKQYIKC